jgi:DNA repair exonuclease SbcCD ATPase subunit
MKARQQLAMKLDEAVNMANEIIAIESLLMELDEVLAEEHNKLASHEDYINQLRETIDQQAPVNESQNAELEACNTRIVELTNSLQEARAQLDKLMSEEAQLSDEMSSLLGAIDGCTQYNEIYKLEEAFNQVGMTIQKTTNERNILCRCQDNKIVTENVIDDFIFIGPAKRLHEGVVNKIKSFVLTNESEACTPAHEPVIIMNEDKKFSLDFLVESERSL